MASFLDIDGITFLSTREAARKAQVSHDYIARLAREERVVAVLSGRRWFVDPVSLERFIEANEIEKQARSARLRAERQAEQEAHQVLQAHARASQARPWAMLQALAVLLLGLAVGQTGVQVLQAPATQQTLAQLWQPAYPERQFAAAGAANREPNTANDRVVYETTIAPNTTVSDQYESRAFVLLGSQAAADEQQYLESLFSDTVTVQYLPDGRGRIVPQLADGPGEAVEFLLVPNSTVASPPRAP